MLQPRFKRWSAAPAAVAENATIVAIDEQGGMRTLREGTNKFHLHGG